MKERRDFSFETLKYNVTIYFETLISRERKLSKAPPSLSIFSSFPSSFAQCIIEIALESVTLALDFY